MSYEKVSKAKDIVVGIKQTVKAIQAGKVVEVLVAKDADQHVIRPVLTAAADYHIPIEHVDSKHELGKVCGIDVKASTVGIVKEK